MKKLWRMLAVCLLLTLTLSLPVARAEEKLKRFPEVLQFSQSLGKTNPRKDVTLFTLTPRTARKDVTAAIGEIIEGMKKEAKAYYPTGAVRKGYTRVTIGPSVYRSGTRYLSFLTTCTVDEGTERIFLDYDARAYDMETGERLSLCNLFAEDSPAWALLQEEVRSQLTGYFREIDPDAATLEALCTREAVEQADFVITGGSLMLYYRADALYPGKNTLMRVQLYLPDLWDMMTDEARDQTDNRRYELLALTFDDGCAGVTSMGIINLLRQYGANATFFIVGTSMADNHFVLAQEHDTGFAMASHNYVHDTSLTGESAEVLLRWKEQFDQEMDSIIGIRPAYMRSPGGMDERFVDAQIGLPLIHWSVSSNDAVAGTDIDTIYRRTINAARDRQVILLHDGRADASVYVKRILPILAQNGIMCVTVDELFKIYGVELEPNQVYFYPGA